MSVDRTVTETELRDAFQRKHFADFSSARHVKELVDSIVAHREQEWIYGDVVKSARNHYYRRDQAGHWHRFGEYGVYEHDYPTRPLKYIGNDVDCI